MVVLVVCRYSNAALAGIFDGVINQVYQDLPDAFFVAQEFPKRAIIFREQFDSFTICPELAYPDAIIQ